MLSPYFTQLATSLSYGVKMPRVSPNQLNNFLVPIPPLEEQKRIVAKIEELMPLVDKYGKAQDKLNDINKNLASMLKKSILQGAIQGKLVEQRPEEGTAHELFEKIQHEKQKLITEGKLKKGKLLPEISEDDIPFEIPKSWKWVRTIEIFQFNIGKTPPRCESKYWGNDISWVSIADISTAKEGKIFATKEKITSLAIKDKFNDCICPKNTLLMSFKLSIGKVAFLNIDAVHNEGIISIFPLLKENSEEIFKKYLYYVLPVFSSISDTTNAIKGETLNKEKISKIVLPLPPLKEQKRIVTKIEELFKIIDGKLNI